MSSKQQKVALITGGAVRLGHAITQALHQAGFNVVIAYAASKTPASKLEEELCRYREGSALALNVDLSSLESISKVVESAVSWKGRLDVLVNNAAVYVPDDEITDWQKQYQINAMAPYYLSQGAYPYLKQNNGSIVNIADINGIEPREDFIQYSMSKAALISQTKSLAQAFAPKVRVNAICPGVVLWPTCLDVGKSEREAILKKTLLGTVGGGDSIAKAILYLIDNDFVTRTVMRVDGGRV